ncbi:MAG: tetrahydrofolate dehydrogenase/cyclohydrolase catalytic domain-containing protein, partial [Chloroflexota bacterium]
MSAQIIDGRQVASRIQDEIREQVTAFKDKHGVVPGLAVLLVGDDPASAMYVRMKGRRCESVGMNSFTNILPADASQDDVLNAVRAYNDDPA